MIHGGHALNEIPAELLETDRAVRNADKAIRKIDAALRRAMKREGLNPRLGVEMQHLLEALKTVRVNLSVLDATVEVVLKQAMGQLGGPSGTDLPANKSGSSKSRQKIASRSPRP